MFIEFGEQYGDTVLLDNLEINELYEACRNNTSFEFIEFCSHASECDTIIVDCCNEAISSKNPVGIKNRERMALFYNPQNEIMPYEVRALRKDFPYTLHQNYVRKNEPKSLCLYDDLWDNIQVSWTPQKHLKKILWWLTKTSESCLHAEGQSLERPFYRYGYTLILPGDFEEKSNLNKYKLVICHKIQHEGTQELTLKSQFVDVEKARKLKLEIIFECLIVNVDPILHTMSDNILFSLGELEDFLNKNGSSLFKHLTNAITNFTTEEGVTDSKEQKTLLILNIPIKRNSDAKPERVVSVGYCIDKSIAKLGEECGALFCSKEGRIYYKNVCIGVALEQAEPDAWRNNFISPIEIKGILLKEYGWQMSGIDGSTSSFNGIIAGVGALGSAIADIWSKEAWGCWTYIDDDYIEPHNIIRHISRYQDIGCSKVEVVARYTNNNYFGGVNNSNAICSKANLENENILSAFEEVDFIVDSTTTLHAPRSFSQFNNIPRCVSIFITPNGNSSVLMLEDDLRKIRLDNLEAQYYRAIMNHNSSWGKSHLSGNDGKVMVGRGCRDISLVMSQEKVLLHAAILARQVRLLKDTSSAAVKIWSLMPETNEVTAVSLKIEDVLEKKQDNWTIKYDYGITNKLKLIRKTNLPNETGGVIVGYTNFHTRQIMIVDILDSPEDSIVQDNSFIRGVVGLEDRLRGINEVTANMVGYIGEWHSHLPKCTAKPSYLDSILFEELSSKMSDDGEPFLMVIVGENDINFLLK